MRPICAALFIVASNSYLLRPVFNAQRLGRAEHQPRIAVNPSELEHLPKAEKRADSVITKNITLIPPEKLEEAANILREGLKKNDQIGEYRNLLSQLIATISNVTKCYENFTSIIDAVIDVCDDEYLKLVHQQNHIQSFASKPGFPAELLFSEKLPDVTDQRESQQGDSTKDFQKILKHLYKVQEKAKEFEPIAEKLCDFRDLLESLQEAISETTQCYEEFMNTLHRDGIQSLDEVSGDLSPCELEAATVDSRQDEVKKYGDLLKTPGGKDLANLELANLPKLQKETASLEKYQAITAETQNEDWEQVQQLNETIFELVDSAVNGALSEAVRNLQKYAILSEGKAGKSAESAVESAKKYAAEFIKQISTISDKQYDDIVNQAVPGK